MRTIKVFTELPNGAKPTTVTVVMLTRDEVLHLAEHEVLMGTSDFEPLVVWLTDNAEVDTEMLAERFGEIYARQGITMERWDLGQL